jgi:hypothetical protein
MMTHSPEIVEVRLRRRSGHYEISLEVAFEPKAFDQAVSIWR